MINILKVDQSNREYFRSFLSDAKYAWIGRKDCLSLGAVSQEGLVLGLLMLLIEDKETCRLVWLYVSPEQRGERIASHLWKETEQLLIRHGFRRILYLATEEDKLNGIWDFLASQGGSVSEESYQIPTTSATFIVDAFDAYQQEESIQSLESIPSGMYVDALNRMGKKSALYKIYPSLWSEMDTIRNYSFGKIKKGRLESYILCMPREEKDGLLIFDLACKNRKDVLALLEKVARQAISLYGEKALVTLYTMNGVEKQLSDYYGGQRSILQIYPCVVYLEEK